MNLIKQNPCHSEHIRFAQCKLREELHSKWPAVGIEPTPYCLQNSCSAAELRWQIIIKKNTFAILFS